MSLRTRIAAPLMAVTALLAVAAPASARWFSPTSFWNTPLAKNAPLDARSMQWVAHMQRKVDTSGTWINTTSYTNALYQATSATPRVPVKIDWPAASQAYKDEFASVPVPAGVVPTVGTDGHVAIYQTSTDTLWEFWQWRIGSDGNYHANTAGRFLRQSSSSGVYPAHPYAERYGPTAPGISLMGGLITPSELQAGSINHAVNIAIPNPLYEWWWTWPGIRSDGDSIDAYDVPEGARFRLPANLDLSKLGLTRTGLTIARAVQKYGMVVRDRSSVVHFYAQDPINLGSDPYPALFGGLWPDKVLANFPWSSLQALKSQPNQTWPETIG